MFIKLFKDLSEYSYRKTYAYVFNALNLYFFYDGLVVVYLTTPQFLGAVLRLFMVCACVQFCQARQFKVYCGSPRIIFPLLKLVQSHAQILYFLVLPHLLRFQLLSIIHLKLKQRYYYLKMFTFFPREFFPKERLFAFLNKETLSKWGLLIKERI